MQASTEQETIRLPPHTWRASQRGHVSGLLQPRLQLLGGIAVCVCLCCCWNGEPELHLPLLALHCRFSVCYRLALAHAGALRAGRPFGLGPSLSQTEFELALVAARLAATSQRRRLFLHSHMHTRCLFRCCKTFACSGRQIRVCAQDTHSTAPDSHTRLAEQWAVDRVKCLSRTGIAAGYAGTLRRRPATGVCLQLLAVKSAEGIATTHGTSRRERRD